MGFSLGYMQYHPGGCGVLTLGQLKIFKMAATWRCSFLVENMKLHNMGFWSMAFSNVMGKICLDNDFTLKCTLKYIAH